MLADTRHLTAGALVLAASRCSVLLLRRRNGIGDLSMASTLVTKIGEARLKQISRLTRPQ